MVPLPPVPATSPALALALASLVVVVGERKVLHLDRRLAAPPPLIPVLELAAVREVPAVDGRVLVVEQGLDPARREPARAVQRRTAPSVRLRVVPVPARVGRERDARVLQERVPCGGR